MKKHTLLAVLCLSIISACQLNTKSSDELAIHENLNLIGLASPILAAPGETTIPLSDYFMDVSKIDSVRSTAYQTTLNKDKTSLSLKAESKQPNLDILDVWVAGKAYQLLLKKSQKQNVQIKLPFDANALPEIVQLVGDVNNWNPVSTPMTQKGNTWSVDLNLNPGRYPYQIVVDDKWMLDPNNPEKASNGMGGFNSVLEVKKADKKYLPKLETHSFSENEFSINFTHGNDFSSSTLYAFWDNYKLDISAEAYPNNVEKISIPIPKAAKNKERSFIRVYAANDRGIGNDLLIPLHNGQVLNKPNQILRQDKEAMIMYFALVDRFYDGIKDNNAPLNNPNVPAIADYMGGDIDGIRQKLDYINDLGANTIWLSPITQNPLKAYKEYPEPRRWYSGYHGYWPITSSTVDHRFGTSAQLKSLVSDAHNKQMNILLDYVCNHVHEEHPIYKKNKDWATDLKLPDGSMNIRVWDEQRLTTWFDTFLPTLDLSNPDVIDVQSDSALFWIKEYDLDGFRHDATKHIPEVFWRTLTQKLKKEIIIGQNRPLYQIGETFGSRELISSYISSGQLDAQFDFSLYFDYRDVFAVDENSFERLGSSLQESFDYYGNHHSMGNITGNHDLTRFMGLASGAIAFDEDPKEAGYNRKIEVKDSTAYLKLQSMMAFIMTVPGVPVIYYGDEIGMVGAGDPDNRRMMRFENLNYKEAETQKITKELTSLRNSRLELVYGSFEMLTLEKDLMIYKRQYFNQESYILLNKSSVPKTVESPISADFNSNFYRSKYITGENKIILEPYSFEILTTL